MISRGSRIRGRSGLFGGPREGDESFLDCVVREVHEEISLYLAPEQFEFIGRYFGPDHVTPGGTRHCEVFVARDVPVDELTITEGRLIAASFDELAQIRDQLAPSSRYALEIFLSWSMRSDSPSTIRRARSK